MTDRTLSPPLRLTAALTARALGVGDAVPLRLEGGGWEAVAALARDHRVLPLVHAGLKDAPDLQPPADILAALGDEARRSWIRASMLSQELARAAGLLAERGIPCVTFKGPALAVQVYGSKTARAMRDIDIAVLPERFDEARRALEAAGYVCDEEVTRLTPAQQRVYARGITHLGFHHARYGCYLELHRRPFFSPSLLPIPLEEMIRAARPVSIDGADAPVLCPWHHFLFVAAHGAKHGWFRLIWIADYAAFVARYPEWFTGGAPGGDYGLGSVLQAASSLSHLCFGTPPPGVEDRNARRLVAHAVHSLEAGTHPETPAEKRRELINLLRLRPDRAYRSDIVKTYWHATTADMERLSLPEPLLFLYPALRPFLWAARKVTRG